MKYGISQLLDIPKLQSILDHLYAVSGIPSAMIDLDGRILTGSGWQDICTKFHRINPVTEHDCIQSDRTIIQGVEKTGGHVQITCPRGLTDTATPLVIEGVHLANIFTGQLFLAPPDRELFRELARTFGFDEEPYLAALGKVPIITQEKLDENLSFIAKLTELLAIQGLTRLRSLEIQERLRESEERLKQIIASAREGIIVYGPDMRYQVWNLYMEQMSGYTAEEVLGKHPLELFPMLKVSGVIERVERVLAGESVDDIEFWFELPDKGRYGWNSDTCGPLKNADGEIIGAIGTVRDITEHKRTEEQLRQAQKMESVGRLAGGVAHDFNNMLTVILGQAEVAKMKIPETHELWQHLDKISIAAQSSAKVTRQLLAFSRKEIIDPKPVNLNDLISDAKKNLFRLIEEDISLVCNTSPDLWTIKADPSQVDQILMNLAVNARDAMPQGGTLFIQSENVHLTDDCCQYLHESLPGDYVLLTVSDSGAGMGKEVLEHIFEPFFTTKGEQGTGLGLATVYGIVKQNGGFINVYSEVGQGTAFKLYFPRIPGGPGIDPLPGTAPVQASTGTVLLVEDNDMVREVTFQYLETLGYRVITAGTAQAGIGIAQDDTWTIDIILTDVIMPEMSGKEMVDRIKAHRPEIKVLFMSGYTADLISKRGVIETGMHYIQKPFNMNALAHKLQETLVTDP